MTRVSPTTGGPTEGLRADLAAATYRVAKRHGFKRAFIDIELDLWDAHAGAQEVVPPAPDPRAARAMLLDS